MARMAVRVPHEGRGLGYANLVARLAHEALLDPVARDVAAGQLGCELRLAREVVRVADGRARGAHELVAPVSRHLAEARVRVDHPQVVVDDEDPDRRIVEHAPEALAGHPHAVPGSSALADAGFGRDPDRPVPAALQPGAADAAP